MSWLMVLRGGKFAGTQFPDEDPYLMEWIFAHNWKGVAWYHRTDKRDQNGASIWRPGRKRPQEVGR